MCFLVKRIGKDENKSALKHYVTVSAQISLFFLIATLAGNFIANICEFNADRFACSYAESCADLSQGVLEITKNNKALTYYYPPFSLLFDHPSNFHRMRQNNYMVNGSVEMTPALDGCPF
ncbi:uncharacterized protein VICG_00282 [Vittaforma corneae ATCC 50505]|uniref:Uncharacterized protein n=1 Tax=Vittaforma corneae (strain ATCC 50505) TaxID=993615 RepID=L2GPV1_VITCO|nr:uncharacterized protein VICG_00282 [Vittaforma corneae ATCC 50505]ELA42530.1 hypothetical protein VICG_00282 [Vittaforma corneae ATCC 50505]